MRSSAPVAAGLTLLSLLLAGCTTGPGTGSGPEGAAEPPAEVVATFYPLAFLAERIAAPELGVASLVPPGVEPHDWEPGLATRAGLERARAFVYLGVGFEPWVDALLPDLEAAGVTLVEASKGVAFREVDAEALHAGEEGDEHEGEGHEGEEAHQGEDGEGSGAHAGGEGLVPDPHVWLDPVRAQTMVGTVLAGLVREAPIHGLLFRDRAQALGAELEALHEAYREGLRDCATRDIIVTHAAFGYVAQRYNITVHSVSGLSPEAEPGAARIAALADLARELNITVVFFERLVSPRVAEAIAGEAGARTMVLDPVEGLTPQAQAVGEDYFSVMRANLANLREAMRCA